MVIGTGLAVVDGAVNPEEASAVPPDFQDQVLWTGHQAPTEIAFAPDGKVFVSEKSGRIYRYDSLTDPTKTLVADLRPLVHNWADRGLLGLAVDPDFGPSRPYIYVQYTYDHILGSADPAPRWGTPTADFDPACPSNPGGERDGCVVSGRLSKLVLSAVDGSVVDENVLIEDWCQQFPSHSIGTIAFGADGMLYAGGGDGASYNVTDWGQYGGSFGVDSQTPVNPCGDGPPPGTAPAKATSVGGAMRSQATGERGRSTITGDLTLSGTVIRVDPDTGLGVPGNPWFDLPGATANEKRVIAYGFRNQFRFSFRGGTNEIWLGDVGWNNWEEINVIPDPTTMDRPLNYGWPCYEGAGRQGGYDGANLGVCEDLYLLPADDPDRPRPPYVAYAHGARPETTGTPNTQCGVGSSAIAGVAYYNRPTGAGARPYPAKYDNSVFFTDYNRRCIWVMLTGANGRPDPAQIEFFHRPTGGIVNLVVGPNGDLFYPNIDQGQIHRITYFSANTPPVASFTATPSSGPAPLSVSFDATASSDPDNDLPLTFAWDLDGDGAYDDATGATTQRTYQSGTVIVGLRVTDARGEVATTTRTITVGNSPPVADITTPTESTTWRVGQTIAFSGTGTDAEDGALAAGSLSWLVSLLTCDDVGQNCVTRRSDPYTGGSGTIVAPDWSGEGNTLLEFRLTATDSGGLTSVDTVRLVPDKVTMTYRTEPSGLSLTVGSETRTTPFSRTVIVGSQNSVTAPSPQSLSGGTYTFQSWSDGGAASHTITAPTTASTYTATYVGPQGPPVVGLVGEWGFNEGTGTTATDSSGRGNNGTTTGTTWSGSGRYGGALSFNGTSSQVTVPDANSLDLTTGMTVEAWVNPTTSANWRTVVLKEDRAASDLVYALYSAEPGAGPGGWVRINNLTSAARSPVALPVNTWSHLATTYDGATLRLYVDGALVATQARTGPLPNSAAPLVIGGNAIWGEYFAGRIDEVRVYNRALSAAEIVADRDRPVAPPAPDTTPPTVSLTAPAAGSTVSGAAVPVTATAADDVGVASVEFRVGSTVIGTDTSAPYSATWNTTALANGSYSVSAVARDAAGNASSPSSVTVTVSNAAPPPPAGLVAAYGFNEASGTTVTDSSGRGNNGTAVNATRTGAGRYGGALSFNGTSSVVNVPDANSLDLTTGVTLSAWVNSTTNSNWRAVVLKENPARADLVYALYGATPSRGPGGWIVSGPSNTTRAAETATRLTNNQWTHIAMTYDGSIIRLYRNGTQVATVAATGAMAVTTGGLKIGGNAIWGEYFGGLIDEVRVYDRPLTAAEIVTIRDLPI
jgi:glucose/arabinose dehydrogenase/PKD repeat protein